MPAKTKLSKVATKVKVATKKSAVKSTKTVAKKTTKKTAARTDAPLLEVRKSDIQGRGGFAARAIRKGQRIIEYTGERISNEVADERYDESKMKRHHTFLFTLDDHTVVDGAVGGNDSIYINHSCEPNCEAVISGKRIYIHALRSIHPGEELLYDYQYERAGENPDEMEKFYQCRCGASSCRGSIMKPAEPEKRARKAAKRGKNAWSTRQKKRAK
jgi:uncharacterized protein